jgi:hypothetical protein
LARWLLVCRVESGAVKNDTYLRIRAACCSEHGLASGVSFRNDPRLLDEHAAAITQTVLKAKAKKKAAA